MKRKVDKEIFRIIDANLNRSREGLRVCEDITRFIVNSPALTRDLKEIRHKIAGIVSSRVFDRRILSESRNADEDVGRTSGLSGRTARRDAADIFSANIERVKESLRVLEEFFKLIDRKLSARFSNLRFKAYTIEKKAERRIDALRHSR